MQIREHDELDAYVIPVLARRLRHTLAGHVYLKEGRPVTRIPQL